MFWANSDRLTLFPYESATPVRERRAHAVVAICPSYRLAVTVELHLATAQADYLGGFFKIFLGRSFPYSERNIRLEQSYLLFGFHTEHGNLVAGILAITGLAAEKKILAYRISGLYPAHRVAYKHSELGILYPKAFQKLEGFIAGHRLIIDY